MSRYPPRRTPRPECSPCPAPGSAPAGRGRLPEQERSCLLDRTGTSPETVYAGKDSMVSPADSRLARVFLGDRREVDLSGSQRVEDRGVVVENRDRRCCRTGSPRRSSSPRSGCTRTSTPVWDADCRARMGRSRRAACELFGPERLGAGQAAGCRRRGSAAVRSRAPEGDLHVRGVDASTESMNFSWPAASPVPCLANSRFSLTASASRAAPSVNLTSSRIVSVSSCLRVVVAPFRRDVDARLAFVIVSDQGVVHRLKEEGRRAGSEVAGSEGLRRSDGGDRQLRRSGVPIVGGRA